ncbi:MAG TPA: hypothetical protein VME46_18570 [Acidimicrobiales bacterium]|nr:hypothetical protein [Acidimicrobiales bacterium]
MRAGELFEIRSGSRRAVVTEQGATLAQVTWDGTDLLARPGDGQGDEDYFAAHGAYGQVLVPWPGRVANGAYEYDGAQYQLPINDAQWHSAIHGLARWLAWQPVERSADQVTLQCRLLADLGYPFPLRFEQCYRWGADSLDISFSAENIGSQTAPFGYGCHPYLHAGGDNVDGDELQVPARSYLEYDGIHPTGRALTVAGSPYDFRSGRPIGADALDVTLCDLDRDEEGRAKVLFRRKNDSLTVTCTYSEPIAFVQLFTGDTLPSARRKGIAVEPYTSAPGAFNNHIGLMHLSPGASLQVHWSLSI